MYSILSILSILFDFSILIILFNKVLGSRKKDIPLSLYIICFIAVELLIYYEMDFINLSKQFQIPVSIATSVLSTFALCYLHNCSLKHKIFITISFQLMALAGEYIFTFLVSSFSNQIFSLEMDALSTIMNFGSKIVLFILICLFVLFWNIKIKHYTLYYDILLFVTPIITLGLILYIPAYDMLTAENLSFYLSLISGLVIINIANYVMLEKVLQNGELKAKNIQMQQQITFQKEKYQQLSAAYRNTRSVVHDTKKHYFAIQSLLEKQQYEKINDYIPDAINMLESTYAKINTGNLVIDSFITNYISIAENEGITLNADININPDNIPLKDYDLCIVLGNMLDNCINGCRKAVIATHKYINITIFTDNNKKFVIHTVNPCIDITTNNSEYTTNRNESLIHGYGIDNIIKTLNSYHGMFEYEKTDVFTACAIVPIFNKDF